MGQKDLCEKNLESFPDVAADIINTLIYNGENIVSEDVLYPVPTETIYSQSETLRNQLQDTGMEHRKAGVVLAQYMIENQSIIDRKFPLRQAGYQGALYRGMYDKKQKMPYPVVGIILYWGKRRWKKPYDLKTLFYGNKESVRASEFADDVKLNLFEMAYLSKAVRNKFRSDMRVVVDYLAEGKNYKPSKKKLKHPKEVLLLLRGLTQDISFEEISKGLDTRKEVTMRELLDRYEKRGEKRGEKLGQERGSAKEIISFGEELDWSMEEILNRLMMRLQIKDEKAREYYRIYSKKM